jgi:hypothetical protein
LRLQAGLRKSNQQACLPERLRPQGPQRRVIQAIIEHSMRALSMRARAACLGLLWLVRELITRIANHADLGPNATFWDKLMVTEELTIAHLPADAWCWAWRSGRCTGTALEGACFSVWLLRKVKYMPSLHWPATGCDIGTGRCPKKSASQQEFLHQAQVPDDRPVPPFPKAQLQRRATALHLTRRRPITVGCMTPRYTSTRVTICTLC